MIAKILIVVAAGVVGRHVYERYKRAPLTGAEPAPCRRDKSGRCLPMTQAGSFMGNVLSWGHGIVPNDDRDPEIVMAGDDCYTFPAWVPFLGGQTRCSERV